MIGNLTGWHLFAILFVILLLFGAPKLPALAKSLGQSMKILKKEVTTSDEEKPAADQAAAADTTAPGLGAPASTVNDDDEVARLKAEAERAKAEAEAAKAEAEALRAAAEKRAESNS